MTATRPVSDIARFAPGAKLKPSTPAFRQMRLSTEREAAPASCPDLFRASTPARAAPAG